MSKIFIVQPHKMLRHAFAIALSPDHEVEISKTMPASADLQGSDLAIVDAASLRECELIDGAGASYRFKAGRFRLFGLTTIVEIQAPTRDKLLRLKAPIDKETLKKTVTQCLGQSDANQPAPKTKSRAPAALSNVKPPETKSSQSAVDAEKKFIELVDIVE